MSVVLVVAPHPDDETLGCGGSILRHKENGDEVHWYIMTKISEQGGYAEEKIKKRKTEIEAVSQAYAFDSFYQACNESTFLDIIPKANLIKELSSFILSIKPNILYIPYRNDVHSDHEVCFDVAVSCSKSFRYPFVKVVRVYEIISETEFGVRPEDGGFRPNYYVNISEYMDRKIDIMNVYKSEMGHHPFPRSNETIAALATVRGAVVMCKYAEAFITLKEVWE